MRIGEIPGSGPRSQTSGSAPTAMLRGTDVRRSSPTAPNARHPATSTSTQRPAQFDTHTRPVAPKAPLLLGFLRQRPVVLIHHLAEPRRHIARAAKHRSPLVRTLDLTAQRELERLEPFDERLLQPLQRNRVVVVPAVLELSHLLDHSVEIRRIDAQLLQL